MQSALPFSTNLHFHISACRRFGGCMAFGFVWVRVMFVDNESYAGDDWAWQLKLSYEQPPSIRAAYLHHILVDADLAFSFCLSFYSNNNHNTLYLYSTFQQPKCFLRASSSFLFSSHYIYDAHDCFFGLDLRILCVCVFSFIQVDQQPSLRVTWAPAAVQAAPWGAPTTTSTSSPLRPSTRCDGCRPILPSTRS